MDGRIATTDRTRITPLLPAERRQRVFEMVLSGKIEARIGQTFPLLDAAEAHRAIEARATTSSTVLIP